MRDQSQISFHRIIILWAGLFSITCQNKAIVLYSNFSNISKRVLLQNRRRKLRSKIKINIYIYIR